MQIVGENILLAKDIFFFNLLWIIAMQIELKRNYQLKDWLYLEQLLVFYKYKSNKGFILIISLANFVIG